METSVAAYFERYINSYISHPRDFVFLRQIVNKASSVESQKPVPCRFDQKDMSIKIKGDQGIPEKVFPVSSIDSIQWGSFDGPTGQTKLLIFVIKGDKPVVLLGPQEAMDLWYDGIRMISKNKPETETSTQKMQTFEHALNYAQISIPEVVNIPPSPTNFQFVHKNLC